MSRRTARAARGVLVVIGLVASVLCWASTPSSAQPRRVVVLGDSIILGAQAPMVAGFRGQGWEVTFDAAESRSTGAAVEALEAHRPLLTDSLVLSFGANDAGDPETFRQRVDQLLDAAAGVPNVYWLTIREVRDYYAPANQILRDAAAARPNVTVLDWHGATIGSTTATAGDGLHLSGSGAALLSDLVVGAVVNGQAMPPAAPAPPVSGLPPVPTTAAPTTAAPTTAAPGTAVPTTAAPTTTVAPITTAAPTTAPTDDAPSVLRETAQGAGVLESVDTVGTTLGSGLALIVLLLAAAGALLAGWSLIGARSSRPARAPAPDHPAVRSQLRAARIAAANGDGGNGAGAHAVAGEAPHDHYTDTQQT